MLSELDMLLQDGIFDTVGQQMNWLCQLPPILQKNVTQGYACDCHHYMENRMIAQLLLVCFLPAKL
jgi:hypothetical protein